MLVNFIENLKTFFKKNQDSVLLFFGIFFAVLALVGFYNILIAQNSRELRVERMPLETLRVTPEDNREQILTIIGNKNSKIYHFDFCIGAKNMKEENKIYFASIGEAKGSGFRAAKNCPGLK